MHSVMRSDFLNRFLSLDRFQRDSRLHVCAEAPPLPRFHSAPFRGSRFYTLFTGPNFGEQLTGNDVASALRHGAEHVDAVEIDPIIYKIGVQYHPESPYSSPRGTVF